MKTLSQYFLHIKYKSLQKIIHSFPLYLPAQFPVRPSDLLNHPHHFPLQPPQRLPPFVPLPARLQNQPFEFLVQLNCLRLRVTSDNRIIIKSCFFSDALGRSIGYFVSAIITLVVAELLNHWLGQQQQLLLQLLILLFQQSILQLMGGLLLLQLVEGFDGVLWQGVLFVQVDGNYSLIMITSISKIILLSISILLTLTITPTTTFVVNPYAPTKPVKTFLQNEKALLNLTQPETLARTLNTIPQQVKQALRIAAYTINFRRVGMKCYYDNCVEARQLKKDMENELKGGRKIGNVYFLVSFGRDGSVRKEGESFWGSVLRKQGGGGCKGCGNIKESVEKLPMFYIKDIQDQKPSPHTPVLSFSTNPQSLTPMNKSQLILNAILDELTDYSTIVPLKLDIFSELLVSGLAKSLQTFVDIDIDSRLTLYYDSLCEPETTAPTEEKKQKSKSQVLWMIATIGLVVVGVDVLVLVGRAVLRRVLGRGSGRGGSMQEKEGGKEKEKEVLREGGRDYGSEVRIAAEQDK